MTIQEFKNKVDELTRDMTPEQLKKEFGIKIISKSGVILPSAECMRVNGFGRLIIEI